ncbi:MAG: peptidase domain-containing ABC transporter [Bacteroidota bacterium]
MAKKFPFYRQLDQMDCGPTCLRMIAKYHGKQFSLQYLREKSYYTRNGVSLQGIMEAAEHIGYRTLPVKLPFSPNGSSAPHLLEAPFPCILHWNQEHFVVAFKAKNNHIHIADPAEGIFKLDYETFQKAWISDDEKGIALLLEPTPDFYTQEDEKLDKSNFRYLFKYLLPHKSLLAQFALGLLLISLFQLIFPFLTQSIVDVGIKNQNIGFIYLILIAQLMIFLGQISVNFIQNWLLLHVSTRINISLISDFLIKLMRLPIGFFDTKMVGDLLQRISDHSRIEAFLTGSTLRTLFSFLNLLVLGAILFFYNFYIFSVFLISSFFYIVWIFFFLKKRKEVDYQRFQELSRNQNTLIELIEGMQEIKLQNSELKRRKKWTHIQARLFRANIRSLAISQYQDAGANSINQLKDIIISFIAAKAVIDGQMTLGMMVAVQYIIGQLNGPLQNMIQFIRSGQDAQISLERLGEIHNREDEHKNQDNLQDAIPANADIHIHNLFFRYNPMDAFVLKDVNLTIPKGKITAIVGTSGSGKTTLVKLLLGFYEPTMGQIRLGNHPLDQFDKSQWRSKCGSVMQDGYIFSDSIANNISESDDQVDPIKLRKAVKTANIQDFIENLPISYNTMIGARGNGISQGQRQRVLIARAVYKNPDFLFFDEATNSLDAKNERIIVENLNHFFEGKTVVIVAHRLSTVKHADQIIVLDQGEKIEMGTHQELVSAKGAYYKLVKDQLELGN